MAIYASQYKDQPALTLESDVLRAQFLPTIGSKMASLVYKPLQREMLVQSPGEKYLFQPYDGHYESAECSGFDEMFPTIDTCFYERYPWQGARIPDHGEVWSLGWEPNIDDERLGMTTFGVRFPYKLEKWVSFAAPHILRITYTLTNLSDFEFDFMWAAHTMFTAEDDLELVLPAGVERVATTFSLKNSMGAYGSEVDWPQFRQPDGTLRDLRQVGAHGTSNADKYFVSGRMPAGWCALKYHKSDFSLALSFPVQTVPYLAVLPNEGGWRGIHNVFLEPATATFDRPDIARKRGEVSTVLPHSTYQWHLNITLANGTGFQSVSEDGEFV